MVGSTIFYAFPIWGINYIDKIETVQTNFFRRVLNLPQSTPNPHLRLELGLPKLSLNAYKLILKFLIKILEQDENSLFKICFIRQVELLDDPRGLIGNSKYNWAASLKKILQKTNITHLWGNWDASTWKATLNPTFKRVEQALKLEDIGALACHKALMSTIPLQEPLDNVLDIEKINQKNM
ncbi:hypothetical protein KQX54_012739 [Cotesia glomerata]|uniref:Uncharacterized protein n=1 Tax=Cotesia glomerata TaxID=32391 RepID=A0AAV7IKQ0_COTGL|nr:hypothetical protein KQX54_012739 [Cotesia glomerata]